MTSENNCIIEYVDNACVEMPSDEIGVNEHDNFCDEPYDDFFDHNCGDTYIENVVGNVDCVVDNVHANPLENVDDNDVLESFTFDDESLSNELTNDLHEICGDDDVNIEASLCDLNDIECVTFHDNCLDDALYIHDLIGKDRSEGVKNENVKEEDKKKTSDESVREEVEEKCGNPGLFGIIVYDVKSLS
nr:hypothetical protein Iba_chr02cCG10530 [Ipomoea batatas]